VDKNTSVQLQMSLRQYARSQNLFTIGVTRYVSESTH